MPGGRIEACAPGYSRLQTLPRVRTEVARARRRRRARLP